MNKRTSSRACVFIDSSNPSMPSQVINGAQPFIKPPFPPTIEPRGLLKKARDGSWSKAPNAFIIYRKLFIETARSDGYYLPMTVISSMASQSWELESKIVKDEYKRLAKEAFNLRNELLPKSIRRRKREKWNIVTFEDDDEDKLALRPESIKSKSTSKPKPVKDDSPKVTQSPPSPISTESSESTQSTPTLSPLTSPIITPNKELSQFITPPFMPTFDETYNWFASPEPENIFGLDLIKPHELDNLFNEYSPKFPFDEHDDSFINYPLYFSTKY
jgi:hypothetical protein